MSAIAANDATTTNRHRRGRLGMRALLAIALAVLSWPLLAASRMAADSPAAQPAAPAVTGAPRGVGVPAFRQANQVAVLTVSGEIDYVTLKSLERRMKAATTDGADAVVIELNTPGGRVDATLDICNLLKDPNDTPPNVVAWVRPQAYSAGTFIALACREIVIAPNGSFGDAAPIAAPLGMLVNLPATERAKLEAPLLGEVVDSARRHHYDEKLVQAFVSVGVELWLLENNATGEQIFVDRAEYKSVFGDEPPTQATSVTPPSGAIPAPVRPMVTRLAGRNPQQAPDSGLTPEELQEQIEFMQQLPSTRQVLTAQDAGQWRLVGQVDAADRLLVVKADEALHFGLAKAMVSSDADLLTFFGAQGVRRYDASWSEDLVRVLTSWPVKALLIVILLVGAFVEFAAPGFGVFGGAAIVALLLLFGAPALMGMSQWWHWVLVVGGLVLVAAELLVIPGTGIAGIAGLLCLLVGLVASFVTGDITSAAGQQELWTGLITTLTSGFAAGVGIWFISRSLPSMPLFNRLVLSAELPRPGAADSASLGLLEAMGTPSAQLSAGDLGVVETDLRPAGRANFNGRLCEVSSVTGYTGRGATVRVVNVGRFVIEVEEARA